MRMLGETISGLIVVLGTTAAEGEIIACGGGALYPPLEARLKPFSWLSWSPRTHALRIEISTRAGAAVPRPRSNRVADELARSGDRSDACPRPS